MSEPKEQTLEAMATETILDPRLQPALDEVQRELKVRERCYDRWVSDGKLSASEARDRFDRLMHAHLLLTRFAAARRWKTPDGASIVPGADALCTSSVTSSGDKAKTGQPF